MTPRDKWLAFGLLLAAALYSLLWSGLATMAESRVMEQLAAQQAHGVTIDVGRHHKSGFPFALRVTLEDFSLTARAGVTVTSPSLVLGTRLLDATHVTVDASRGTLVTMTASGTRPAVETSVQAVAGDIRFGLDGLHDIALTLDSVSMAGLVQADAPMTAESIAIKLDKPDPAPTDHTKPGAHLVANITKLFLPGSEIPSLGNTVERLTLDAMLMGKIPALEQQSLAAWRDDGGTIEVREFSGQWGQLNLNLGGTLALDPSFQPEGSLDARITGFNDAIDALAGTHAIKGQYSDLIKMGLSVIAKPAGDNDIPTLTVPLTIQDRALYLARFKIMKLPEVHLF